MSDVDALDVVLMDGEGNYLNPRTATTGAGIPPSICKNLKILQSGTSVSLWWKDPNNTVLDKQYLCTWGGTKIVKKLDEYPQNENDGTLVEDSQVWGQYQTEPLVDTIDDADNDWKYAAFPYSTNNVTCYNKSNQFGDAIIYEMIISTTESNPSNKVTYAGANEDFEPGRMNFSSSSFNYGDWEDTFIIQSFRPCMLNFNGTVDYYLNKSNARLKEDGSASDVTNSSYSGNVMVEVDQIWIKEEYENNNIHIYFANKYAGEGYDCWTHYNKNNQLVDHYYYRKYQGSVISNKVRSISNINPTSSLSGITQRDYCKANGNGWDTQEWSFYRLMTYLHVLVGKTTNAREAFGYGYYTGSSSGYAAKLNGLNDDKGMFYGTESNATVTTFYMDDFYCNLWELCCGLIQKSGKYYVKMTPGTADGSTAGDYNTDGTGYLDTQVVCGQSASAAYIQSMSLVPGKGLFPSVFTGASATTYYCNGFWTANVVGFARTGGDCYSSNGFLDGLFALNVNTVASHSFWNHGASLSYKRPQ